MCLTPGTGWISEATRGLRDVKKGNVYTAC